MCKLFIAADAQLWTSVTRSLRIDGMVTSVRLESYFWSTLADIGARDQLSIPQLLTRLYHESIDAGHDLGNFSSFLRVCCMRYLSLQLAGELPTDKGIALADMDVDDILAREQKYKSLH